MSRQPQLLVVDDDERFALLVACRLRNRARCFTSLCGEGAVLQFEHHLREKRPFNAVLMDIEMPGMDGHEAVRRMREIEKSNGVAPLDAFKLVMLTAHRDVRNVSRSFFQGQAEAFIPKETLSEDKALIDALEEFRIL